MSIEAWSDDILIAALGDEPSFSEEVAALLQRIDQFGEDTPEVKYLAKIMKDSEMLGYTVATVEGFYKLTPTSPSSCKVTMVVQGKLGGSIPKIAMDSKAISAINGKGYGNFDICAK